LAVELGLLGATAVLEEEVTRPYGRRHERQRDGSHSRYGRQRDVSTPAGQKLPIDHSRVQCSKAAACLGRLPDHFGSSPTSQATKTHSDLRSPHIATV